MPVQVQGEILSVRKVGAYQAMTVVAPGMAELTRPGHTIANLLTKTVEEVTGSPARSFEQWARDHAAAFA